MRARIGLLAVVLTGLAMSTAVPVSGWAVDDLIVPGGSLEGERERDGTSTLTVSVTNLPSRSLILTLQPVDADCTEATGTPQVAASTTTDVTFTMRCGGGGQRRTGTVVAVDAGTAATEVTRATVAFTLETKDDPDLRALWWFLVGAGFGLVGVVPPYVVWRRNPLGNPDPTAGEEETPGADRPTPRLSDVLPGITSDWTFTDNWAANVGLAAAVFTSLFATNDTLEAILGDESSGTVVTISVAAALSAALIGAAPLLLVIFKRRYRRARGVAKHNTILGVLVASYTVLTATAGLVATGASLVHGTAVIVAAVATGVLLLAYAWKSIPQTLALGSAVSPAVDAETGEPAQRVSGLI